jgi:hypothetical protein
LGELAEQCGCTATAVFYALIKLTITRKKRPLPIEKSPKNNVKRIQTDYKETLEINGFIVMKAA